MQRGNIFSSLFSLGTVTAISVVAGVICCPLIYRAFGLWLDGELDKGITDTCMAFQNSPLTGSETHFACAAVEVYSCDT